MKNDCQDHDCYHNKYSFHQSSLVRALCLTLMFMCNLYICHRISFLGGRDGGKITLEFLLEFTDPMFKNLTRHQYFSYGLVGSQWLSHNLYTSTSMYTVNSTSIIISQLTHDHASPERTVAPVTAKPVPAPAKTYPQRRARILMGTGPGATSDPCSSYQWQWQSQDDDVHNFNIMDKIMCLDFKQDFKTQ